MPETERQHIRNEVIIAYRRMVEQRYQFAHITERYDIPESFTEERVDQYRAYFLNYIYPPPERREQIDRAFNSLDTFLVQPNKILSILRDSTMVLLRHGRHLPRILKASLHAFRSFRAANAFEEQLVNTAKKQQMQPPFSNTDVERMIASLSRKNVDHFIDMNRTMLETLYDRKLMKEITSVVEAIVGNMRGHLQSYSLDEIQGMEIGLEMIREGNRLFQEMNRSDQLRIFNIIISLEVDVLERIFAQQED